MLSTLQGRFSLSYSNLLNGKKWYLGQSEMFIGTYYHTLEAHGRVSLPKAFREKNQKWVVTRGLDGGLFLFSQDDFFTQLTKLSSRTFTKKRNRDFVRLMTNEAIEVEPDKNGRVQLPEYLIAFAKLKKELVIVGSLSKVEIWDRTAYHTYVQVIEDNSESIAESLEEHNDATTA